MKNLRKPREERTDIASPAEPVKRQSIQSTDLSLTRNIRKLIPGAPEDPKNSLRNSSVLGAIQIMQDVQDARNARINEKTMVMARWLMHKAGEGETQWHLAFKHQGDTQKLLNEYAAASPEEFADGRDMIKLPLPWLNAFPIVSAILHLLEENAWDGTGVHAGNILTLHTTEIIGLLKNYQLELPQKEKDILRTLIPLEGDTWPALVKAMNAYLPSLGLHRIIQRARQKNPTLDAAISDVRTVDGLYAAMRSRLSGLGIKKGEFYDVAQQLKTDYNLSE